MLAPIHSSLLYLGPDRKDLDNLDMEKSRESSSALDVLQKNQFKVFIVTEPSFKTFEELREFLKRARQQQSELQIFLLYKNLETQQLIELFNSKLIQGFCSLSESTKIEWFVRTASEKFDALKQKKELIHLFNEQNEALEQLREKLESRVEKRQKYLNSSQKRLAQTNEQIQLLHLSLVVVQKAQTVKEMESQIFQVLGPALDLDWVRIIFTNQSNALEAIESLKTNHRLLTIPFEIDRHIHGSITFARDYRQPFRETEEELLNQVTEAVSLAISRLIALEESEALKAQWETTFNAFSEPLCLIDQNNRIVRSNRAMMEASGRPYEDLVGKDPFEILLRDKAPSIQDLKPPFRKRIELSDESEILCYDVLCQNLTDDPKEHFKIAIFRDVTEELRLERHALESSKMAELGVIGSSIAHELNNPLGGMLSFLQLIKMDLNSKHELWDDIQEMEKAAKRCKDIVESLLGFARRPHQDEKEDFDLHEAIHHALKLVEIQTKTMGLHIDWEPRAHPVWVHGNHNQIVQALRNVLQNSIEAIERKRSADAKFVGHISLDLSVRKKNIQLTVQDNGDGIPQQALPKIFNPLFSLKKTGLATGLGLTVAFKILADHGGHVEISSQLGVGTSARISLKSPEMTTSSQVFDRKI